jgi:hypothetical protein
MAGPNRRIKAPKVYQGTPGKAGRYAPSSRKQPSPTGLNPSNPAYGMKTGGGTSNPIARAARVTGTTTGRNLPSGQGNLEKKAPRQVC